MNYGIIGSIDSKDYLQDGRGGCPPGIPVREAHHPHLIVPHIGAFVNILLWYYIKNHEYFGSY